MNKNKNFGKLILPMSDTEFVAFHKERFAELSDDIIIKAENAIKEYLSVGDVDIIKEAIKSDPIHWASLYHFNSGMEIRNLLRDKVCLDDVLPSGNWDDYYVCLIECAVGMK